MEKSRQELVDNYKAEQRAIKVRKVLRKTKEWGENIAAMLFVLAVVLVVALIVVTLWRLGLGFVVIGLAVVGVVVLVWTMADIWADEQLEKARYQRSKTREED